MRHTILAAALGLSGCTPENTVSKLYPDIVVSPQSLDFGDVVVEYESTLPISIQNSGDAPLTIEGVSFDGSRSGAFTIGEDSLVIERDEVATVDITFAPPTYLAYTDTIIVHSDAPDEEEVVVRLFGEGVDGPKPDISVTSLSYEFDEAYIGTESYQVFEVENKGEGDLEITGVSIDGSSTFSLLDALEGQTITGGSVFSTALVYAPDDEEGDNATLTITSNDPDEETLTITLLGNGGGDFAYPVADFDCPTDVAPLDNLRFDASASYDPNGAEPLDYFWTLSAAPDGSGAELEVDGELAEMMVDIAGDYTVSLVVQNSVGIWSETKSCSFEAIPTDQIHVELLWSTDGSDLDLHMVRSGSELFEEPGDVCYCNPAPEWGEAGEEDNPTLDLDDMYSYGPENINIETPAEDEYTVYVHYFLNHGGGASTATVRVYLYGELVAELYELMEGKDLWEVGTISWPAATFTASDAELTRRDSDTRCED